MKYVHTNLISQDWQKLAGFYIQVFQCKLLLPKRDLSGDWLSKGTAVSNAQLKGAHLRLPGYGKHGPTLEIFQYNEQEEQTAPISNRTGFGHLAFEVDNVQKVLDKALKFGGTAYGEIATKEMEGLGTLTFIYIKDPEGNIIELLNWGKPVEVAPTVTEEPTQQPKVEQQPKKTETPPVKKTTVLDSDEDAPKTKRALLNELYNDLDDAKRLVDSAKTEIEYSKEDAQYQQQKAQKNIRQDYEVNASIPKTKAELLEELKQEMGVSEQKIQLSATPEQKTETPVSKTPQQNLPNTPAKLTVELKIANNIQALDIATLELKQDSQIVAHNLRSFTNLLHPPKHEQSFLEWLGKQFKADLVPLLKQVKTENNKEQNNQAWALTPRFRDSLQHFLGKCQEEPELLAALKLDHINLSPKDWINTYQDLLTIVLAAEAQRATYIRLNYSAE